MDRLCDFAYALARTHSAYRGALGPRDPNSAIAEELIEIRDQLHTDALGLAKRKLMNLDQVDKYRSGLGHKAIATDVDGLVGLFREAAPRLAGKTAVTEEELDHAARLAARLVVGVGVKEQDPAVLSAATLLRAQAFTLFINAYDEVRRAVTYLRWHQGDADSIAPSLWAGRSGKRAEEPTEATTPSERVNPSTPAAPVPVGFPGSSPFIS